MVRIYHVVKGDLKEIQGSPPVFYSGDVYVIDNGNMIWIWIGKDATVDETYAGAWFSAKMDKERGTLPRIKTVFQGKEPDDLIEVLGGAPKVEPGGEGSLLVPPPEVKAPKPRLLRIKEGGTLDDFEEVPLKRESLDSGDTFILDAGLKIWVWIGKNSSTAEKFEGGLVAKKIDASRRFEPEIIVIEEGNEPNEFWKYFEE